MSNPFITPGSSIAERAQSRRKKFKLGVYAFLITMTVLLLGMLIQGCRAQQSPGETLIKL